MTITIMSQSLRQVATYNVSCGVSLRIFEEQSSTSSIPRLLIAEPLLDWQRDEQGRPLINAVSRVQGGGAVFELRLIISTLESQQAVQRAVSSKPRFAEMELITQIDSVHLELAKGTMGELLEFCGGEMYPSRNENVVLVDFESSSLTANEEDIEKVRSILRSIRLICKASVNGHELPPISLDFSTIASSISAPSPPASSEAAAVNDVLAVAANAVCQPFRAPHSPRTLKMPFAICARLAWTQSGNLVATIHGPSFFILKPNGEIIRQINSGPGLQELKITQGVAVSAEGLIFISDHGCRRINVYTEDGVFLRSFGGPGNGNGQFHSESSMAISKKTENLFVADYGNNRIQVFDQAGKFLYLFGQPHLVGPFGIGIDDEDNVVVSEYGGRRVSVFTLEGRYVRSFGCGGSAPGQLMNPYQLSIDQKSGRILVADYANQRVQVFNKSGAVEYVIPTGMLTSAVVTDKDGKVIAGGSNCTMMFFNN